MKRWLSLALVGLAVLPTLVLSSLPTQAQEYAGPRKTIYLYSPDFPPAPRVRHPLPPDQVTRFWQLLDKEMKATPTLALTENLEEADYRVELECAGTIYCSRLNVSIQTPQRDVLGTFVVKQVKPLFGSVKLDDVSYRLVQRLDERMGLLKEGGYGYIE